MLSRGRFCPGCTNGLFRGSEDSHVKLNGVDQKGLATFLFGVLCRCVGNLVDDEHLP